MYASLNGWGSIVWHLAEDVTAELNHLDNLKRNCLHWAARFNMTNIARMLIQLRIKYDAEDADGKTPLELA